MSYNPRIHHRRSIRLRGFDYSTGGAYFVTICTHERALLFKEPPLADIIERAWRELPSRFGTVELDEFIIMPNHVHFTVWLVGASPCGRPGAGASPAPTTLADVVGTFKSRAAVDWLNWIKGNAPDRSARVWQRDYYECIIRNEEELNAIRQYIRDNPAKWAEDKNNPANWHSMP